MHHGPSPHDFLLYGYPGERVRREGDDLIAEPLMMHTVVLPGEPRDLKRAKTAQDLFLAWRGDAGQDLRGISGAPVWAVADPEGGVWSPNRAMKLIAVEVSVLRGEWIRSTLWGVVDHIIGKM